MNKEADHNEPGRDAIGESDDALAKLMNLAGPRADIPAELQARVHRNVRDAWSRSTRYRQPMRWAIPAALAATVLLAISIGNRTPVLTQQAVGTIASVTGVSSHGGAQFKRGDAVQAGDILQTGDESGLSVALNGDVSLRVAANTAVRVDRLDSLTLLNGLVYVDSGERIYRDKHITIHTADAIVTDVGTQFSVFSSDRELNVAVREGRVDIGDDKSTYTAMAGDTLTIPAGGDAIRGQVAPSDPSWDWATALSPGFDNNDRSLLDLLKWAARESGKELVFPNNDVRLAAMATKLYGSFAGFTPDEAIASALATTHFKYRIEQNSITIAE